MHCALLPVCAVQEFGKPPTQPSFMLDLFMNRVNHTELKLAALYDLMFSQCDRHQQNIFLTEKGGEADAG
jgi:hypothetical protein